MKWYPDLYVGESLSGKDKKIRWLLSHDKLVPTVYLITMARGGHNQVEIIAARELAQPWYPKKDLRIIGLAGSKSEAIGMIEKLLLEAYERTGEAYIPEYLRQKWRERK